MKTWILLWAMFVPMEMDAEWKEVTHEKMTAQECSAAISEFVLKDAVDYRTITRNDRSVVHVADIKKLLKADSILLTCFDTAEKSYVDNF